MFMGDNHALEIAGIGTIKLKMYDGLIRTISGVRHVKDLKKNLLSVGQFDSLGCKIRTDNGIMKIIQGALVVLKARKTVANMFVLMGETHYGAKASIASSNPAEEKTMMWHQKLGHMSEKGLKVLSDQKLLLELTKETTTVQMENTQNRTSSEAAPEHEEQEEIESETPKVTTGNLCGPPLRNNCSEEAVPSQPVPNDEQGDDGFIDMEFFYISFGVCYTIVVIMIATVLYISIHFGDAGGSTSSKTT
ncbi:hypothetical protein POTOM_013203 [Populus tomentosa]|uniref:GAG-pre-integrase domain-containing protein n=1 Tax=Populus tomentosa TaxID=118781 RepID=A0A8X8D972_POPTO|nr:hypothetical protein POTOM_013203 [Populus tomentosa]